MQRDYQVERLVPDLYFLFKKALYEEKTRCLQLSFNIFSQPFTQHTIKTKCIKLLTIDPEICSILIFQQRVWGQFFHHIFCMIFEEKCFACYTLLTDQMLLSDCLYFLRNQAICLLQLFVNHFIFLIKSFLYVSKKSRQKLKYLDNDKSF